MNSINEERVFELVAEVLHRTRSEITTQSRFIEDLEANSLDVVELACLIEGEFDLYIPESEIPSIRTVGDVIHALRKPRKN